MMPWLSVAGVADYLAVTRPTVYALVKQGTIPQPTYLTPRCPRWRTEDIDRALTGDAPRESLDDAIERIGRQQTLENGVMRCLRPAPKKCAAAALFSLAECAMVAYIWIISNGRRPYRRQTDDHLLRSP